MINYGLKNKRENMQKRISKIIIGVSCVLVMGSGMLSCKKYNGDSYDFSNTVPQYLMFSTTSLTFNDKESEGLYVSTPKNAILTSRIGLKDAINAVLTIQVTGGISRTVNVTYNKFATTQSVPITITESDFPSGVNTINGTITLTSASGDLRLGYPTSSKGTVIQFKAYRPGSPVPEEEE